MVEKSSTAIFIAGTGAAFSAPGSSSAAAVSNIPVKPIFFIFNLLT